MYLNVLMHSQQMLKYQTSLNKKCVFSLLTLGLCDSDIISDKSVTHVLITSSYGNISIADMLWM